MLAERLPECLRPRNYHNPDWCVPAVYFSSMHLYCELHGAKYDKLAATHGKPACAVKHDQKLGTYRERIDNCRQYSAINDVPPVSPPAYSWLK